MTESLRLQVFLARCGVASRRACERMIGEGRVSVNGRKVVEMGQRVVPNQDKVAVDNKPVHLQQTYSYIVLNKPKGVMTTCDDPHAERTVLDLLPLKWKKERLYPVGRLDVNSRGLVLLTNDGPLTNRLLHPGSHIPKRYEVAVLGDWTDQKAERLRAGVTLEDGRTAPADVRRLGQRGHAITLAITLHEGRKRQIRRMLQAVDCRVVDLVRVAIGPVKLEGLPEGEHRPLFEKEVQALRKAVQPSPD